MEPDLLVNLLHKAELLVVVHLGLHVGQTLPHQTLPTPHLHP